AWFARLARMAPIVIAVSATASAATKTLSAFWTVRLRFSFIDGQGAATQFGPIQRGDSLIGFAGIGHLHKSKTARAAGFAVRYQADFLNCTMRLKNSTQFSFGCAVGQIAHVKVLHC